MQELTKLVQAIRTAGTDLVPMRLVRGFLGHLDRQGQDRLIDQARFAGMLTGTGFEGRRTPDDLESALPDGCGYLSVRVSVGAAAGVISFRRDLRIAVWVGSTRRCLAFILAAICLLGLQCGRQKGCPRDCLVRLSEPD